MTLIKFSTQKIPPAARKEAVEGALRANAGVVVDFVRDQPIAVDMSARDLCGVHLAGCTASSFKCRNVAMDDRFILVLGLAGTGAIQHPCGRMEIRAGHASIVPFTDAWTTIAVEPVSLVSIALPRELLPARYGTVSSVVKNSVPFTASLALLATYAKTLLNEELTVSPGDAALFARHIRDLAALGLGAGGDRAEAAKAGGQRAVQVASIKSDIAGHLAHPELSLGWLARRHGMGARQIQNLFYAENTNFSAYVLEVRLEQVRRHLLDATQAGRTIVSIAFAAGFGDLSWFNRVFRRRFGMSPSDMRALGR